MDFFSLLWIIIIITSLIPVVKQKILENSRYKKIREIEDNRKSRVIALIHRQEMLGMLGIMFLKYISIEDAEKILRAIRLTPDDIPIDMILHTPGGIVLPTQQISYALKKHPAKVTVFVPHYAMSGGTLIALSADDIVIDENAVLGPIDPQIGEYPASSLLEVIRKKKIDKIEDKTIILADIASKAIKQVKEMIYGLLRKGENMTDAKARKLSTILSEGRWTHDHPITFEEAKKLGLPVKSNIPKEVHELMALYPQPPQRRPSVQYIPLPYKSRKTKEKQNQKAGKDR
ncbi:MAG: hypothetical protein KAS39_07510 [Actinomycetia bacterium]|nr:hypothetical protein [Actinomycetes bacterium]